MFAMKPSSTSPLLPLSGPRRKCAEQLIYYRPLQKRCGMSVWLLRFLHREVRRARSCRAGVRGLRLRKRPNQRHPDARSPFLHRSWFPVYHGSLQKRRRLQSNCCGFETGVCQGAVYAQENDGGCGYGDPEPNSLAAEAIRGSVEPGNGQGATYITAECMSDADCASKCCGKMSGKCAGHIYAMEKCGGCGFSGWH